MFYNCHIHTFTDQDIPDRYLPLALARIIKTNPGAALLSGSLKHLVPFTDRDMFEKYSRFLTIGKLGSQAHIFHECAKFYPADTRFLVHSMDLAFMNAGKVSRPFTEQLNELAELAAQDSRVVPFMMVDPRRDGVQDLLREMHSEHGFKGIKIYPPLGYYPFDQRLDAVYEYCIRHKLPVMAHCGPLNPTYFRGSRMEIKRLLNDPASKNSKRRTRQELCAGFAHPSHYREVFKRFPDLKICLAHFGSGYYWERYIHDPEDPDNWFTIIKDMLVEYEGLYTDISFTMSKLKYFSLLKVLLADQALRRKILFGSDFYMVNIRADERRFGLDIRAFIGEQNFDCIARENPVRYLGLEK